MAVATQMAPAVTSSVRIVLKGWDPGPKKAKSLREKLLKLPELNVPGLSSSQIVFQKNGASQPGLVDVVVVGRTSGNFCLEQFRAPGKAVLDFLRPLYPKVPFRSDLAILRKLTSKSRSS